MVAYLLHDGGHDAPAPEGPSQPVADLGSVRLADLDALETAATDQVLAARANRPLHRTGLLPGNLCDQGKPFIGRGVGVREGDAEGAVVNVPVVEMLDEGILVRRLK